MTREERVQACITLMRDLKWARGKTGFLLAAEWGMSPDSVEQVSAEAWRRVKAEVMDPEKAGPDIVRTIGKIMADSMVEAEMSIGKERTDHRRVALEAAKVYAAVVLARPTKRHEVSLRDGRTPEELEARKREILKELAASIPNEDDLLAPTS